MSIWDKTPHLQILFSQKRDNIAIQSAGSLDKALPTHSWSRTRLPALFWREPGNLRTTTQCPHRAGTRAPAPGAPNHLARRRQRIKAAQERPCTMATDATAGT